MSMFSGKCDFYDSFVMISSDGEHGKIMENLKTLKLYVYGKDGREHRVKSETIKDITKYYPYLTFFNAWDKDNGDFIILSSDSFIDQEEREHLGWYIDDVMKYWRKCKRNKVPFVVDECVKKLNWINNDIIRSIAERVAESGNKAEFDDIHLPMQEYYRRQWFEEMVKVGYTEREAYDWCFKGFFAPSEEIERRLGRPLELNA